jgi:hypothetical protein
MDGNGWKWMEMDRNRISFAAKKGSLGSLRD